MGLEGKRSGWRLLKRRGNQKAKDAIHLEMGMQPSVSLRFFRVITTYFDFVENMPESVRNP
jgi:hypothetical protein